MNLDCYADQNLSAEEKRRSFCGVIESREEARSLLKPTDRNSINSFQINYHQLAYAKQIQEKWSMTKHNEEIPHQTKIIEKHPESCLFKSFAKN